MTATISSRLTREFSGQAPWSEFQYAILESPTDTRFAEVGVSGQEFVPESFDTGILFGPTAELRWLRRRNGMIHIVYISDLGKTWPEAEVADIERIGEGVVLTNAERTRGLSAVQIIYYQLNEKAPQPGGEQPIVQPIFLSRYAAAAEAPTEGTE